MKTSSRLALGICTTVWGIAGIFAGAWLTLWWDRARSRHDSPELSGWGILFFGCALLVAIGLAVAYRWKSNHVAAVSLAVIVAVLATLGIAIFAPNIGWGPALHLLWIVLGISAWVLIMFVIVMVGTH